MSGWARELGRGLGAHVGLKSLAGSLIVVGFFLGYFLLLKFPLWPQTMMPVTAIDRWIAFWPGALWLYFSLWLYIALAPGLLTDRRELLDYYRVMVALSLAGMVVFLLWPTASPRPEIDWRQHPPFGSLIAEDDAGNALPSLHAAFAVFTAIWLERLLRRADAPGWLRVASAAWGLGIVYSTLATRQHVAVDVMAGSALGWLTAVLHARWLRSRRAPFVADRSVGCRSVQAHGFMAFGYQGVTLSHSLARPNAEPTGALEPTYSTNVLMAPRSDVELLEANRSFYDPLWQDAQLVAPERFNTWPLVQALAARASRRLEVAPGLRPRLPIAGSQFVDISEPAVTRLREHGGDAVLGNITALPFPDRAFDLVCALDIVEHVDDEDAALSELSRVAAPGAAFLLSVPLHPEMWTAFDDFVGHRRRYEPQRLRSKLREHGFAVEQSAVYGMQPKSSRLLDLGMWALVHRRERAMWWYNRVFMPLGLRFQKKLALVPGMIGDADVAEIILVCRKP